MKVAEEEYSAALKPEDEMVDMGEVFEGLDDLDLKK